MAEVSTPARATTASIVAYSDIVQSLTYTPYRTCTAYDPTHVHHLTPNHSLQMLCHLPNDNDCSCIDSMPSDAMLHRKGSTTLGIVDQLTDPTIALVANRLF